MSLFQRRPISIGRRERQQRDDRVFVIATEDTHAPKQYFGHLALPRVRVIVLETPDDTGHSSPIHVLNRLRESHREYASRKEIQHDDEFWVLIDTDHHFDPSHRAGTLRAMTEAKQKGFRVAVSNPCFELWLLLHHQAVEAGMEFGGCGEVEAKIRELLGSYNKAALRKEDFPPEKIPEAIGRARQLDTDPNGPWPQETGTHVYRMMERILGKED